MSGITIKSTIVLNDGVVMPLFGLGMYQMSAGATGVNAVRYALRHGYRMIDTAAYYNNEDEVGQGVREENIPRKDAFIVTKVNTDGHGYERCKQAVATSLKKLNLDYIDLHLIHSPYGAKLVETYDALLEFKKEGKIRSVGVSNFNIHHLEGLKQAGRPAPSVNQIELHMFLKQQPLVDYCKTNNIAIMAYCPLAKNEKANDPTLLEIAKRHNKTVAQVMIRWCLEQNYITIPKSEKEHRISENAQVFDFHLTQQDLDEINTLPFHRTSWNPLEEPWSG